VSIASLLKPSGISHAEFLEWNPALTAKTRDIPAGYRVKAPSGKLLSLSSAYQRLAGSAAAVVAASKSSLEWILHHVAPGETLYKIARNYRVTVDAIQQANGLNGNRIAPGQQLKIPKKT
jgi:LysM repeat protein